MVAIEQPPTIEVVKIDPLKRLNIVQVCKRIGRSRRTIEGLLAQDRDNRTPGKSFPAPVKNPLCRGQMEWSEFDLAAWLYPDRFNDSAITVKQVKVK